LRFAITSTALLGSSLLRNCSFCEAITLPLIFSLPVVNSFIASALPCVSARKSSCESSSVHSPESPPDFTEPAPLRSSVQVWLPIFHR
jgi:hypothetical protein